MFFKHILLCILIENIHQEIHPLRDEVDVLLRPNRHTVNEELFRFSSRQFVRMIELKLFVLRFFLRRRLRLIVNNCLWFRLIRLFLLGRWLRGISPGRIFFRRTCFCLIRVSACFSRSIRLLLRIRNFLPVFRIGSLLACFFLRSLLFCNSVLREGIFKMLLCKRAGFRY